VAQLKSTSQLRTDGNVVRFNQPQVYKTSLSKEDDVTAGRHSVAVNLGLDIDSLRGVGLQPCNINLNVEVANASKKKNSQFSSRTIRTLYTLANNSIFRHGREVVASDDITVTSGSHEDI
jgi:hypothetical protein